MITAFIHGFTLSLGLILPLGVQNIFIFNQGATHRKLSRALPAVITAGICDTILILLSIMGVSIIVFSFEWLKNLIFLIGFIFLLYIGWSIFKSNPILDENEQNGVHFTAKRQIAFAASVSLLNPHAIIDTIGVIGPSSLAYNGSSLLIFTVASVSVSWIWFFGLAITGKTIGKIDGTGHYIKRLNQLSALIIWGMAIYIGFQVLNS